MVLAELAKSVSVTIRLGWSQMEFLDLGRRGSTLASANRLAILDGFLGSPDRLVSRCESRIDELEFAQLPMVIHVRTLLDCKPVGSCWRTSEIRAGIILGRIIQRDLLDECGMLLAR